MADKSIHPIISTRVDLAFGLAIFVLALCAEQFIYDSTPTQNATSETVGLTQEADHHE